MGTSKTELFSTDQNRLADAFKALGHPARMAILQHIMAQEACICTDLVAEIGLAQATVSQHLKALKNAGILKGTVEGKSVCYCIDEAVWAQLRQDFHAFFSQDVSVKKACC